MLIDLKLVLYEVMVVGKDDSALRASLRVVACGNAFFRSNRTLVEASHPSRTERYETVCLTGIRYATGVMVVGKDDSALRASPFGSLPAATLSRCARIEP